MLSLLSWAVEHWNVVQARAVLAGLIGPNGAARVLDLAPVVLLSLIEAILAETPDVAKQIDDMYEDAKPIPPAPPPTRGADRRAEIDRFMTL